MICKAARPLVASEEKKSFAFLWLIAFRLIVFLFLVMFILVLSGGGSVIGERHVGSHAFGRGKQTLLN